LGLVGWLLLFSATEQTVPPVVPPFMPPAAGAVAAQVERPASSDTPRRAPPLATVERPALPRAPRIVDEAALEAWLSQRGLDGPRLVVAYRDWLAARGFPDAVAVSGLGGGVVGDTYAQMDGASLDALARTGDLGAIQAEAARTALVDGFAGIQQYTAAIERGSAAAVFAVADILVGLSAITVEDTAADPDLAALLGGLRQDEPGYSLREDALTWALAAIERDGPAILDSDRLAWLESTARELSPDRLDGVCSRVRESREYLHARAPAEAAGGNLPPVFITPRRVHARLPCAGHDVGSQWLPVRNGCQVTPAANADGQSIDVWVCPGTRP
jgi:hypothetical protein